MNGLGIEGDPRLPHGISMPSPCELRARESRQDLHFAVELRQPNLLQALRDRQSYSLKLDGTVQGCICEAVW